MSNRAGQAKKDPFRATLNLPQTGFSMKANLRQMEPAYQKRWARLDLYQRMLETPHPRGPFCFHDGPPYANGHIHVGHLLNKTLKDLVVRSRTMEGHDVRFVPGWDCHGLPIEHRVLEDLGEKARTLSTAAIRSRCQRYAEKHVKLQAGQMQRLGTTGDYAHPYLTMKPEFEARTLEVFADLVAQGVVYRDLKPVHWSIANQTALADAELEYYDRKDTSVYVGFEVNDPAALPTSLGAQGQPAQLMIWTTTPWTLPANLLVATAAEETYGLYALEHRGRAWRVILAEALVEAVFKAAEVSDYEQLGRCSGTELVGVRYQHPFVAREGRVVIADYVTAEDGTGLVHTAPGHGTEDYQTGLREGVEVYCPVRADGTYDATVPEWLQGQDVWTANGTITEHVRSSGHLFYDHVFDHSYPHDWRSKTPTIFRATEQWFIAVDKPLAEHGASLRALALEAVESKITFGPAWGQSRLRGMLEARPDWCISRQRSWGLPIPAFLADDREPLLTPASVRAVAQKVKEKGSDLWFRAEPEVLLEGYNPADDPDAPTWLREGGASALAELRKSADIFDVWFESGSSWNAVLRARDIGYPADLYLEGSDQHRGWFQLSLLPALGVTGESPFKHLLTHGFVVDAEGRKMSKSLGNSIEVDELLEKYGADICRWWVSSLNFANDIRVDWSFFQSASEDYRKVRNTLRFFLGNLFDFNPETDAHIFTAADAPSVDAWALAQRDALIEEVRASYQDFQYRRVRDALFNFCNDTMSAVYLAAIKDRLYCEAPNSPTRRRTQTTLFQLADAVIRLAAPVIVHTADQAYLALHDEDPDTSERSVHLEPFPEVLGVEAHPAWAQALELRQQVLKALEVAKERGIVNSMDAGIVVTLPAGDQAQLEPFAADLVDLCGVSRFRIEAGDNADITVEDLREEPRCERSWKRDGTVVERPSGHWLSDRDAAVMASLEQR